MPQPTGSRPRRKLDAALKYLSRRGAAPGTLALHPEHAAGGSKLFVIAYDEVTLIEKEVTDLNEIKEYLNKYPVTWLNINGVGDLKLLENIAQMFNLHALAMEDVVNMHQRPKTEEYDNIMFAITRMPEVNNNILELEQISIFWGKNFVITFQANANDVDCLGPLRNRIKHGGKRQRLLQAEYLAYALLDTIVDSYFPILEQFGTKLDDIEEDVVLDPVAHVMVTVHEFKHDLQIMRRALWAQREAVRNLNEIGKFTAVDMKFFIRDCEDHTVQLLEIVETYRERMSGLMDIYLSGISTRTNQVMKVLTIAATILMSLSLISSVYGMNFDLTSSPWNMPELRWKFGYFYALGLMTATGVVLFVLFWRKGWLKR